MTRTRTVRTLALGAAFAAAVPIATAVPAAATDCGEEPEVIVSNDLSINGTDCAEIIYPGPDSRVVFAEGGDDTVIVLDNDGSQTPPIRGIVVDLGDGDDTYIGVKDTNALALGGEGGDHFHTTAHESDGATLNGGPGDDTFLIGDGSVASGQEGDDHLAAAAGPVTCARRLTSYRAPGDDHRIDATQYCQLMTGGEGNDVFDVRWARPPADRPFGAYLHGGTGDDSYNTLQPPKHDRVADEIREPVEGGSDTAKIDELDIYEQDDHPLTVEVLEGPGAP